MKSTDYQLEQHFSSIAKRPNRKGEETITSFNRNIFWYNRTEVPNQQAPKPTSINYSDHRRVIETAVNILRASTPHEIALTILTHRNFADYRQTVFGGKGSFTTDYAFLLKKIGVIFDHTAGRLNPTSIRTKLTEYITPTLVQVNHITGTVSPVTIPSTKFTLTEWASKYNTNAVPSTSYQVAGLSLS